MGSFSESGGSGRCAVLATGDEAIPRLLALWRTQPAAQRAGLDLIALTPAWPARSRAVPAWHVAAPAHAARLAAAWPPCTPDLHRIDFAAERVSWLVAPGPATGWLPQLDAQVDLALLGDDALDWPARAFRRLGRLMRLGGAVCLSPSGRPLLPALRAAGFEPADGADGMANEAAAVGRRDETTDRAAWIAAAGGWAAGVMSAIPDGVVVRYQPRAGQRRHAPGRASPDHPSASDRRRVVIVGAGLAGCATARALAERGGSSVVLERRPGVAAEASGNPAGLFHGVVHAGDGPHARLHRIAALAAQVEITKAIEQHAVAGSTAGALRLESRLALPRMQALLDAAGLPPDYVQALDPASASSRAGVTVAGPAWFYPGGGWVDPAGLARSDIERAGALTRLRTGSPVARLSREGGAWRVFDAAGAVIEEAETVVLANAFDAVRLLGATGWPVEAVRGQLSNCPAAWLKGGAPRLPMAGAGYVLPVGADRLVFGATADPNDADGTVRTADQVANLARLQALVGTRLKIDPGQLDGRTAWRCTSADRLPLIGAVPWDSVPRGALGEALERERPVASSGRGDRLRDLPRIPGLHVVTALGSRGIAMSALGARWLAARLDGAPAPLANDLVDAIDPARYALRLRRRTPLSAD